MLLLLGATCQDADAIEAIIKAHEKFPKNVQIKEIWSGLLNLMDQWQISHEEERKEKQVKKRLGGADPSNRVLSKSYTDKPPSKKQT
eukprot:2038131-Pyramimonas_sp.AAC.1